MKKIAYPLYDVVFKYLMEDLEVARRLLGGVIGREIQSLENRAQEHTYVLERHPLLTVYRLDFVATIRTAEGSLYKVAIEVQKSKDVPDILRFRRYLGEHYANPDRVEGVEKSALPIITIYIVGFDLESKHAIVRAEKCFYDVVSGERVEMRSDFVQLLTHESYFIQALLLPTRTQNKVERLLSVFSRKWAHDAEHNWIIEYEAGEEIEDEDLKLIIKRLELAIADAEVRKQIQGVEEAEREIEMWMRQKDEKIEAQEREIGEKEKALGEKEKTIEEKDKTIEEKEQALEDSIRRSIRALRKIGMSDEAIGRELEIDLQRVRELSRNTT